MVTPTLQPGDESPAQDDPPNANGDSSTVYATEGARPASYTARSGVGGLSSPGGTVGSPLEVLEGELVSLGHDGQAPLAEVVSQLSLVVIGVLAPRYPARNQHRQVAGPQDIEGGPASGVAHNQVGIAHRRAHLIGGHQLAIIDRQVAHIGMAGPPQHLGVAREDLHKPFDEAAKGIVPQGADRDDQPADRNRTGGLAPGFV